MLKRIYAISLSLLMLVSICPMVSVFATDSKPAAVVEDFEAGTVDSAIVDLNSDAVSKAVTDDVGRDGGKALKISSLNNTACIGFKASYRPNYDALVLSYDIQVSKASSPDTQSNKEMVMAGSKATGGNKTLSLYRKLSSSSADFSFKTNPGGETYDLEIGKWYRIVTLRTAYTMTTWVLDENNSVLLYQTRAEIGAQDEFSIIRGTTNAMGDGEILVDNVSLAHYDATLYGPSLTESTIEDEAENIPRNTNSVTVSFDGVIDAENSVAVLKSSNEEEDDIVCKLEPVTDTENDIELPLTYKVSWKAVLGSNTKYTLDLTGMQNEKGVIGNSSITFKTLDASQTHLWNDATISSVNVNSSDSLKTDIKFTLEDIPEYANDSFTGTIMAVLYRNDSMAGFDLISDTFTVGSAVTKPFELGDVPVSGDRVQLMQMDTQNGLIPLAIAEIIIE